MLNHLLAVVGLSVALTIQKPPHHDPVKPVHHEPVASPRHEPHQGKAAKPIRLVTVHNRFTTIYTGHVHNQPNAVKRADVNRARPIAPVRRGVYHLKNYHLRYGNRFPSWHSRSGQFFYRGWNHRQWTHWKFYPKYGCVICIGVVRTQRHTTTGVRLIVATTRLLMCHIHPVHVTQRVQSEVRPIGEGGAWLW